MQLKYNPKIQCKKPVFPSLHPSSFLKGCQRFSHHWTNMKHYETVQTPTPSFFGSICIPNQLLQDALLPTSSRSIWGWVMGIGFAIGFEWIQVLIWSLEFTIPQKSSLKTGVGWWFLVVFFVEIPAAPWLVFVGGQLSFYITPWIMHYNLGIKKTFGPPNPF